jgi:shikimate dehydrogenase
MKTSPFAASDLQTKPEIFRAMDPPACLAVCGHPVAHSLSPAMHNAALREAGHTMQYVAIDVPPESALEAFRAMPAAGFLGTNVTIPLKQEALEACDEVEEDVRRMGAVNTLLFENGKTYGFSTDGPGLVRALRDEFYVDLKDLRVMLLGAGGGAGRAVAFQCAREGCERLILVNRTAEKAHELRSELSGYFGGDRLAGPAERLVSIPWEEPSIRTELERCDLIVNASAVGMKRTDPPALSASLLTANLLVYDTVYSAGKTKLVEAAESVGARAANGRSMLLHQGALSYEIWFNRSAPLSAMRSALQNAD